MSINHVILGVLNNGEYTGYDLKKIIADNVFLPWSGNNNQIYKALIELKDREWVSCESVIQDNAPNKKIYTLTADGREELRNWLLGPTELPELQHPLFTKLLFADALQPPELEQLLLAYQQDLHDDRVVQDGRKQSLARLQPSHSEAANAGLSSVVDRMLEEYLHDRYLAEIRFIERLLLEIRGFAPIPSKLEFDRDQHPDRPTDTNAKPDESTMPRSEAHPVPELVSQPTLSGQAKVLDGIRYIDVLASSPYVRTEIDAVDLLTLCSEHDSRRLLIEPHVFCDDFYRLKTGLAGIILQKLVNYHVKVALLRAEDQKIKGKFLDFLLETNRGQSFRIFDDREEAISWLCR